MLRRKKIIGQINFHSEHCVTISASDSLYYRDMVPPSQGSNLSQDSSLNMTPRENCYISGYEGPDEISQDVPGRARIVRSMVNISDLEGEIVTCGSPYKFAMLNCPKLSHHGKTIISHNW